MQFLKNILAAFIGICIFFGGLFLLLIAIAAIAGGSTKTDTKVKNNSILKIHLDQPFQDYGGRFEITDFNHSYQEYNGLNNFLYAIEQAKTDDHIKAISIETTNIQAGMAQIKALRNQLVDFKTSGKKIYAYGDVFTQKDYYLSSIADSIYINPVGELDFKGLASEVLFFKELQEKSGIKMEVIRHGKYKSAVEPFLSDKMSPANREQITALLTSIWSTMVSDIATDRQISNSDLNAIADSLGARFPKMALANKLVDQVAYYDQYTKNLVQASKLDVSEKPEEITLLDYAIKVGESRKIPYKTDKIAVVYAQGDIMYTDGDENTIGPKTIIEALTKARENDKVKAIVLRVNSPGGSALASELIWREVELTKAIKPVIVSMGNLAASGGYYIACNADHIIAEPSTITGSIGVFGVLPNFTKLADKIGINAEQVVTNKRATGYSPFEPLSEDIEAFYTESIEEIYNTFVQHVADGRGMNYAEVDSIAQGRVWTGTDALQNGLVDELGGLELAITRAAEKAETDNYAVKEYPVYKKDFQAIFNKLSGLPFMKTKEKIIQEEIGEANYTVWKSIKELSTKKGVQARIPYNLVIE